MNLRLKFIIIQQTDKEHVGKFTIISGDKTVDLSVKKMATGVNNAPFYLKAGDMHAG